MTLIFKSFTCLATSCLICATAFGQAEPQKSPADQSSPALDLKDMDPSVKPQQDFFLYANGSWIKRTEIPPDQSRWGSFNALIEKNNDALHTIAEKAAKTKADPKLAPEVQKVGDYYASGMDEKNDRRGEGETVAGRVRKTSTRSKIEKSCCNEIAHLHTIGVTRVVRIWFRPGRQEQHDGDCAGVPRRARACRIAIITRRTMTLRRRLRDQYVEHVTKMLTLAGEPAAKATDAAKKDHGHGNFAGASVRTRVELRDPQKNYNKMTQTDLQTLTPDWNWADYFKEINLTEPGDINVGQPDFFKAANEIFTSTSDR